MTDKRTTHWLITGGCGFIGTSLIEKLTGSGQSHHIRVLDNISVGSRSDLGDITSFRELAADAITGGPDGAELVVGDIRDASTCNHCCKGIDVIVHLAANTGVTPSVENPLLDMECNVIGTVNMLEAARMNKVGRFVFASSGAPAGEVDPPIHEGLAPKPVSPYGASKLAGEGYCSAYHRTFGITTVALRFGNVYGPLSRHKSSVVAKFFRQALKGETLEIYGDGNQTRDFIYIEDLLQAVVLSAASDVGGEIFQIATHRETTVNEIANMIKCLVESSTGRTVTITHGNSRLGDVRRNYSDITKAATLLGYRPVFDLRRGLEATFAYFRTDLAPGDR